LRVKADALVISGGETDVCVLAAVMDAVDAGYRVVLAADALCSVSDESHDAMLRHFGSSTVGTRGKDSDTRVRAQRVATTTYGGHFRVGSPGEP